MAVKIAPFILGANFCNMVMNVDMLIGQLVTAGANTVTVQPNLPASL